MNTPISKNDIKKLHAGDTLKLNGILYTARDAAHKRILEDLKCGKKLNIEFENQIIYYTGPSPAKPNEIIGSAGPTTSYRMDTYTPYLLEIGISAMIGKGNRSDYVVESIIKNKAIYFGAIGGAGALLSNCIKKAEIVEYEDLGPEAVRKLYVEDFPVIVVIDSYGKNLYETERKKYSNLIV